MGRLFRLSPGQIHARALASSRSRAMLGMALALAWALLVIGVYYTKLWIFLLHPRLGLPASLKILPAPYAGEALLRAGAGISGAAILLLSALLLGGFLLRLAGSRSSGNIMLPFGAALAFSVAIGIGAFAYAGLLLAPLGLYRQGVLLGLVALPLLAGAFTWLRRGRPLPSIPHRITIRPSREALWSACAALAVLFAFLASLAPEREFDALWYHLAYPQRYLQAGRLVDLPTDYVSLYPMTWELWYGYGLALGGQTAAKLLHFACLPLTALALAAFIRRFVPRTSPTLAVALFAAVPTVIWEASTAYNDLALALYLTLAAYALFSYAQEGRRSWLFLAAICLGLAVAIKHLALVTLFLFAAGLALYRWREHRSLRSVLAPCLFLLALPLAIASPWYLRSFLASGNPVFPELFGLFGAPPARWDATTQAGLQRFLDQFGPLRTPLGLLSLPWHSTTHAAAYAGALGPLFLMLLPFLAFTRPARPLLWLAAFVALFVAFWASPLSSFQMRFLIPITPILAILAAAAFDRLESWARLLPARWPALLPATLAVLLLLNLPPFTVFHERDRSGWLGWINSVLHGVDLRVLSGAESQDSYLARNVDSYPVWSFANRTLPPDAFVLAWSNGDQFYSQRARVWAFATALRPIVWTSPGHEAQTLDGLRRLGVTHIILDRRDDDAPGLAMFSPAARVSWYQTLYEDRYYTLYRLRWESLPPASAGAQP